MAVPWETVESDLNRLSDRHRFAFRMANGEAHAVRSPALDEAVIRPALLSIHRPGWEEVDRSFREALLHQRGGHEENDDALTAANAALEAALKASGIPGNTLGDLVKAFRGPTPIAQPQLAGIPEALEKLLKSSGAIRNTLGDAHGKEPGAQTASQAVVDLTIHMVGALIVYVADVAG